MTLFRQHTLYDLRNNIRRHAIVNAPSRQNHMRVVAELLRFVGQVVRVHADTMAANQPWAKRQEVPLRTGCLEDFLGIDTHQVKDHRQLIDKRDVHVTLRVLDNFRGLGNLDA